MVALPDSLVPDRILLSHCSDTSSAGTPRSCTATEGSPWAPAVAISLSRPTDPETGSRRKHPMLLTTRRCPWDYDKPRHDFHRETTSSDSELTKSGSALQSSTISAANDSMAEHGVVENQIRLVFILICSAAVGALGRKSAPAPPKKRRGGQGCGIASRPTTPPPGRHAA